MLDREKQTISFSKNGRDLGVAYKPQAQLQDKAANSFAEGMQKESTGQFLYGYGVAADVFATRRIKKAPRLGACQGCHQTCRALA